MYDTVVFYGCVLDADRKGDWNMAAAGGFRIGRCG